MTNSTKSNFYAFCLEHGYGSYFGRLKNNPRHFISVFFNGETIVFTVNEVTIRSNSDEYILPFISELIF